MSLRITGRPDPSTFTHANEGRFDSAVMHVNAQVRLLQLAVVRGMRRLMRSNEIRDETVTCDACMANDAL